MINILFILLLSLVSVSNENKTKACLNVEELALYNQINEYRAIKKLPPIPFSLKLTLVAQTHVQDLSENYDYEK